ncbi:MAG: aldo/keto reductase [Oscillospiraceae bacterium]|jgi:predicted aldo/keto reductase-like oxidoreductase|nr:aldo/keto reductase [Oscillospiraceae bacterium]
MQYRLDERSGNQLSVLGFGCMRFSRGVSGLDYKKAEALILSAVEGGVNYFDTAYLYPGSEALLGAVVSKNSLRDRLYIATKLPIANCKAGADFDKFFALQLAALQTTYIDYYLMHNINSLAQWDELRAWGIEAWIAARKASGEVRQVGFSFHGPRQEFEAVLDSYDWDFCQIQYNYANENNQAGAEGLRKAASKHIPVIIMEPLLGGKLANGLSPAAIDVFRRADASRSPAQWGLRWLWNQAEVTVVLSGMNEAAQLSDNLAIAEVSPAGCVTDSERAAYEGVINIFKSTDKVPCTGCAYCMPCPKGVNIPGCFASYNTKFSHGFMPSLTMYITSTAANRAENALASRCVKCGKCETHCPQKIEIRRELETVARKMEPWWFRVAMRVYRAMAR